MGIVALVNADSQVCIREPGDQLIYSQPIINVIISHFTSITNQLKYYNIIFYINKFITCFSS